MQKLVEPHQQQQHDRLVEMKRSSGLSRGTNGGERGQAGSRGGEKGQAGSREGEKGQARSRRGERMEVQSHVQQLERVQWEQ